MSNNNNNQSSSSSNGGIGFFGLLAIVFITLKLTGYITWSWFWVLAPLWGGLAFGGIVLLSVFMIYVLVGRG